MDRISENKIILVKRKTRLQELIARFNTVDQARFYIEHLGADFSDYLEEDEKYRKAISDAATQLEHLGRLQVIDREHVPNFIFGQHDLVLAIGQDGLVANTLKYLSTQMLIGINPDPARWDGVLLKFGVADVGLVVQDVFKKKRRIKEVTMAKAVLNDGQSMLAVNDFFIGQKTHVSSRYTIGLGEYSEQQSSSGVIISTGLGSTGWMKSVITGAMGITSSIANHERNMPDMRKLDWNTERLLFSVREPFPSKTSQSGLIFGWIEKEKPLKIVSQMPENGVIFSDGIENDFLQFTSGVQAMITLAENKGHLVV